MPRGGARPGAGRKPKLKPGEAVRDPAVPMPFTEAGVQTRAAPPNWPFGTKPPGTDVAPASADTVSEVLPPAAAAPISDQTPLDYLLKLMRDELEDPRLRLTAAQLAAPYVHARPLPGGKKDAKSEAAKAAGGRFATTAPPRLVSSR